MTAWAIASEHLAAMGLTDVPPEIVGKTVAALALWIPGGLGIVWVWRHLDNGWKAAAARQARVSANFRVRWPTDRIWQAPYAELEAEIFGCWQLVIILESRNNGRKPGIAAEECDRQIAALSAWASTLLGPFNAAAVREQRVLG